MTRIRIRTQNLNTFGEFGRKQSIFCYIVAQLEEYKKKIDVNFSGKGLARIISLHSNCLRRNY